MVGTKDFWLRVSRVELSRSINWAEVPIDVPINLCHTVDGGCRKIFVSTRLLQVLWVIARDIK